MRKLAKNKKGAVLPLTLILIAIITGITIPYFVARVNTHYRVTLRKVALKEAYYAAHSGVNFALLYIANHEEAIPEGEDEITFTQFDQLEKLHRVTISTTELANVYLAEAEGYSRGVTKLLRAYIRKNPPSKVFDYVYFLNNWGWWYGSSIYGWGDVRSNGRFDFKSGPTLYGEIFSHFEIDTHGNDIKGSATNPEYQHPFIDRVEMPNLYNVDYYVNMAEEKGGSLMVGSDLVIDKVHEGNLYLEGTDANPIRIDGPVVVTGNVIIKGKVTGQGTIYAGRNIYIAGDITYVNPPDYAEYKSIQQTNPRDYDAKRDWVDENKDKDLLVLAATENIWFGDYTKYYYWQYYVWNNSEWGLKYKGDEHVGADGIPGTDDDDIPYDHDNDPDTPPTTWYDIDGDGEVDDNYNWDVDVVVGDLSTYNRYPTDGYGKPIPYSNVCQDSIQNVYAVGYTNHAYAGMGNRIKIYGALITKDEAVVSWGNVSFVYDERLHSRYNLDPNRFVDLGIPPAYKTQIVAWEEP